jgi:sortase (surface protein transpeptidase)
VRVYIPALAVDAEIQDTGYDARRTMQVVAAADIISWLREGAIPGNDGNAILAGHNKWGGKKCPLFELDTLQIGDEMVIEYGDGSSLKFMLESVFVYALATAPANLIMDISGEARVTVITCKAPFNTKTGTSDNRIVAIFKEESVFIIPDPPIEPFPPTQPR